MDQQCLVWWPGPDGDAVSFLGKFPRVPVAGDRLEIPRAIELDQGVLIVDNVTMNPHDQPTEVWCYPESDD